MAPPSASTASSSGRPLSGASSSLRHYSVQELREATGNFNQLYLIGEGGFGKVFRAMVGLTPIAIKVLDPNGMQGLKEFHNELRLLGSMSHPHVVRLLGYAAEGATQSLVYELMSRGNLEDALALARGQAASHSSGRRGLGLDGVLPWHQRVRIAAQVACAIDFLHSRGIIHRDIKPANVFLDCDMNAKLGDIGLAAESVYAGAAQQGIAEGDQPIGTWSYLAPEYKQRGRSSVRTDIYAYGLTVLQLLTSAPQPRELIRKSQAALEDCTLLQVVDPSAGAWDARIAERVVKLALWCCMHDPEQRPPISTISTELSRLADLMSC